MAKEVKSAILEFAVLVLEIMQNLHLRTGYIPVEYLSCIKQYVVIEANNQRSE